MFELLWKLTTSALVTCFLTAVGVVLGVIVTLVVDKMGKDPHDGQAMGMFLVLMMFVLGIVGFGCGIAISAANW